ncbi:gene transfer agent family protein [Cereibacter sphaeroides]|uniref:Gene transfer agent family protein n=1 Tax=Cereibacter sphaeroides TaxID=1063 RepID=A0AAX1UNI7_CERSP|nr:gene transfer agent family protein [Cereibacter sphaeroides]RHZ96460.1 gene transfer agent family protein [Cereibacter sphaeroides]
MDAKTLHWPGGEHRFLLRIGELRALQRNCDAGPEEVFNRLRFGKWRVDDIIEPIRLGLIGSGEMTADEAGPFVALRMQQHPPVQFKLTALAIMSHSLMGDPDDVVGEPEAGEAEMSPESGASPATTATAP